MHSLQPQRENVIAVFTITKETVVISRGETRLIFLAYYRKLNLLSNLTWSSAAPLW